MPQTQYHQAQAASKNVAIGLTLALLGAVAFSGKAIIVKLAYRYGVDAVTLIMFRMLFALPIFAVMAWWASRGKPPLTRRDWLGVLGLGVSGYYLASFLDFAGLAYISASLERLILYLNPTLVVLLGWALYGRGIRWAQAAGMLVSYSGVVLVFGHEANLQGANAAWGTLLVFLSAVSYAIYLVYSGEMVQRLGSLRLVGLATTVACLCCLLQFAVLRPLSAAVVAPEVIWLSVLNATLCTAAPVTPRQRRFAPAGPPGECGEDRQRKQHAVHDEGDRIDPVAVGQLDDDGFAAEGDGPDRGHHQAGGHAGGCCGGGTLRPRCGSGHALPTLPAMLWCTRRSDHQTATATSGIATAVVLSALNGQPTFCAPLAR